MTIWLAAQLARAVGDDDVSWLLLLAEAGELPDSVC